MEIGDGVEMRARARTLGLAHWLLPSGPLNAITDVAGVRVGHVTLVAGEGALRPGVGPVRTGVTAILPHGDNLFAEKVCAAVHTINGYGKACGFEQVRELGVIETPIVLTNTLNVWLAADAVAQYAIRHNPAIGIRTSTVNPVVGETNDGYLNDIQGRHVRVEHVWRAIENASDGVVAEGSVGAGTGTSCFGWKGGVGTASRCRVGSDQRFCVGALVQSNFGRPQELTIGGVPIGRLLQPPVALPAKPAPPGSVMIVLATDAPLDARQLQRLCRRAAAGLACTGSTFQHGSGDFVIAFSTARRIPQAATQLTTARVVVEDEERLMDWLFPAVVESVEEAVLNSLCMATTTAGRDSHVRYALPLAKVQDFITSAQSLHNLFTV
jgi:D-aminopeptidase